MTSGEDYNLKAQLARAEIELNLEKAKSIYRFHFFFVALVFAMLSFSVQFRVNTNVLMIKVFEIISWITLAATGFLGLIQVGGYSLDDTEKYHKGLNKKKRILMWVLFTLGVTTLLIAKILYSFSDSI